MDHGVALGIAKQKLLSSSSTHKFNLRLILISEYLQRSNIEIYYKPGKQHIIPDVLFQLAFINLDTKTISMKSKLDILFTILLVSIDSAFKQNILERYKSDLN